MINTHKLTYVKFDQENFGNIDAWQMAKIHKSRWKVTNSPIAFGSRQPTVCSTYLNCDIWSSGVNCLLSSAWNNLPVDLHNPNLSLLSFRKKLI